MSFNNRGFTLYVQPSDLQHTPELVEAISTAQPPAAELVTVPPTLRLACNAAVPHPAAPAARKCLERQLAAGPLHVGAGRVEAPQGLAPGTPTGWRG